MPTLRCTRYPDRSRRMRCAAPAYFDASVKELRRALDELGLCGVIMACSIQRTR